MKNHIITLQFSASQKKITGYETHSFAVTIWRCCLKKLRVFGLDPGAASEERSCKKARKAEDQGEFTSHWLSPHFSGSLSTARPPPCLGTKIYSGINTTSHTHCIACILCLNLFIYRSESWLGGVEKSCCLNHIKQLK